MVPVAAARLPTRLSGGGWAARRPSSPNLAMFGQTAVTTILRRFLEPIPQFVPYVNCSVVSWHDGGARGRRKRHRGRRAGRQGRLSLSRILVRR